MIFGIIFFLIAVIIPVVLLVRGYNYNHRIGEGIFKNSEYNLDEADEFVDKNYYDSKAFNEYVGRENDRDRFR